MEPQIHADKVKNNQQMKRKDSHQLSVVSRHAFAAAVATALLLAAGPCGAGEADWKLFHDQAAAHLQGGDFEQAELFARAALQEAETPPGLGSRTTEQSLSTLSHALSRAGKHDEAILFAQRLVAMRTKQYGPDDPATGLALHNNAQFLILQGNLVAAEQTQLMALVIFEKKLGGNHINTAVALHNLGAIQLKQENFKEAEKYLRRALAAKEKALKPGNLSIAHTLDNLAAALDAQGRQIEAEKLKRRAEGIRRKAQPSL